MRLIVIILLLGAIASLAYGASGLLRSREDSSDRLHRALRLRIGFSVALFLLLLLAWQAGLIEPHGLGG
jgi:ABC-type nitrate/sulfonate/bicarbonate transport system substrate-binding protein